MKYPSGEPPILFIATYFSHFKFHVRIFAPSCDKVVMAFARMPLGGRKGEQAALKQQWNVAFTKQQQLQPENAEDAYRRYCAGEQDAFDFVIEEFRQSLIFFLHGYVHNVDTAEDLAEDTFVELLIHKSRFNFQSSLKTYLFAVARHKAIDYLRREKRRGSMAFEELDPNALHDGQPSTEDRYEELERADALERAMEGLPEEYREVLRMLYLERFSYDDIAAVLKKSKKQIDNLSYRARQALREDLRKEGLFCEERV